MSLSTGFDGDIQLPQAVETPAPARLFQMTSPLIRKPRSSMRSM